MDEHTDGAPSQQSSFSSDERTRDDKPSLYADYILVVGYHQRHIEGELPVYFRGLSWTALMPREIIRVQVGDEAAVVNGDTVVGRGQITHFVTHSNCTTLHVAP